MTVLAKRSVLIDRLTPHPRNYQTHPPDQIEHVKQSLTDFGQYKQVVVARDLTILAGHGVVEAMRQLGWEKVDVSVLDLAPDDPLALRLLAGDNEISNLADVNDRQLAELLRELANDPIAGLLGTGFDDTQLAAFVMVTRPPSEMGDMSAAGEWVGLPGFDPHPKNPQLNIQFDTVEDRDKLLTLIGVERTMQKNGVITTWWPPRGWDDLSAVRFEPLQGPESDETGSEGIGTADDDMGERADA